MGKNKPNQPDEKYLRPKRFIIKIICNRCGVLAPCTYSWMPDRKLVFMCLSCGEQEIFDMDPIRAEQEDNGVMLGKEDVQLLKEALDKKTKENYGKN